jgi:chromosomal replication initiator protein
MAISNLAALRTLIQTNMLERWLSCTQRLESEVAPQIFKTWLKPMVFLNFDEPSQVLRVGLPSQVKLNWVKAQFGQKIQNIVHELISPGIQLSFEVNNVPVAQTRHVEFPEKSEAIQSRANAMNDYTAIFTTAHEHAVNQISPGESFQDNFALRSRLNPQLTFQSFVDGTANRMARAATLQVSERPGTAYNPLFLYGGVGLGKTHLMHAAGNALLESNPNAKIRYVHAQEFFEEMVRAIQKKTSDKFRAAYQELDLLLLDDIQFLSGKDHTQSEFFYIFEGLFAARKQIIITCDTYPKEMKGIEERLVSRFDSGLIVVIEPPELEMRIAILQRKAEQRNVNLPHEVAYFIAKALHSNVRELEGALNRLIASAEFHHKTISLELAKDSLRDLLELNRPQLSVEEIQKVVANYFKLKVADMYSKRRPANIAHARQVAMYIVKEQTQKSLPEIGEAFGGRDHTTVLHAVRKITEQRQHDESLNHAIHVLEQTLRA